MPGHSGRAPTAVVAAAPGIKKAARRMRLLRVCGGNAANGRNMPLTGPNYSLAWSMNCGREKEVLPNGGGKAKKMENADDGSKIVTPRSWLLFRPLEVFMSLRSNTAGSSRDGIQITSYFGNRRLGNTSDLNRVARSWEE